VPTVPIWLFPETVTSIPAVPGAAVAVKACGEPFGTLALALKVFVPATVPSVPVALAWPFAAVVAEVGVIEPSPLVTAKVTVTPETGFPYWSFTCTTKGALSGVQIVVVWPSPDTATSVSAAPAFPVAVNVCGEPLKEPDVAVKVFVPAAVPSFPVALASPLELVVAEVGEIEPPPLATAKVTLVPETAFPYESLTLTTNGELSAVPTVPVWLFPETVASVAAAAALMVMPVSLPVLLPPVAVIDCVPAVFSTTLLHAWLPLSLPV
jgi:hypothetical protein